MTAAVAGARTLLFVPASRTDRFAKAVGSDADAVVIDLEDAVEPAAKDSARIALCDWLTGNPNRVAVRINAPGTDHGRRDIAALRGRRLLAVLVPKAERPEDLAVVREALGMPLLPIVETAAGLTRCAELTAADGVVRAAFGALDLAVDIGVDLTDDIAFATAAFPLVLASATAGIAPPLDAPATALRDHDAVAAAARRAKTLGFGGKLCIHPAQVAPVLEVFTPTAAEQADAARILAAAQHEPGAFALDGRMVDKPVIDRARRVLAAVQRYQK